MADTTTITSVSLGRGKDPATAPSHAALVLLLSTDELGVPSSRHILADVDEVRFARGERAVVRRVVDGRRVLEIAVPDRRMSAHNGTLTRGPGGWVLEDPSSKNGAVVDGVVMRRTVIADGAVFELGHTFFVLRTGLPVAGASPDTIDEELAPETPVLATFDPMLAERFRAALRVAATDVSMLLIGETGTGKELVARTLHEQSHRRGAFVAVNCGALPPSLVEAELFGYRRGAFTGAVGDRVGLVRSAEGGTLFLDEVGELPMTSQAAFLRVLQEREVVPVGGDHPVKVDIRLFAATLRDLESLVRANEFRRDLYARLFGFTLALPALRERRVDLGLLIRRILRAHPGGAEARIAPDTLRALIRHDWPFNIRELEKVLHTALALAPEGRIELAHLPDAITAKSTEAPPTRPTEEAPDELHARLLALLEEHRGNVRAVSAALDTARTQVYRWIDRYGIDVTRFRR